MGAEIDRLDIAVEAQAMKANDQLDKLVGKLEQLSSSLSKLNVSNFSGFASGVKNLSSAMSGLKEVRLPDYTRLAKGIEKFSAIDSAAITGAGTAIAELGKSLRVLDDVKISENASQIAELGSGIKQLGYKSATKAIDNIPKLATAMKDFMGTLSKAPKVNQNLIDMTNALAKLSRTGASSGRAATSLAKSLDTYTASTSRAGIGTKSLTSALSRLYMRFRSLTGLGQIISESINISSDLTEVQNVVDVTFGEYSKLIDKMSETSITNLGMSPLTLKQTASQFQAMGSAMGFTQEKMTEMSTELTKLTADMASFYNVEQKAVAEDLASIFTGEARPLRTYGLDLTQATLQEWALNQGMNANIQSMSQMEKTMLRYQYVLANTGAAQGDFARTANTWANQTRILKQNFEALAGVIGGTFINALKPLVQALNSAMSHIIAFAKTVSDSLGKIFGWQYEETGGGFTSDFADIAGSTGDIENNLSGAANSAKKMQSYLLGIDQLNIIEPADTSTGTGGGSTGTGGTGSAGGGTGDGWTKVDSIFKGFESELDTLYKLGDYISQTLSRAMESIDWESIYEKAGNFGAGLADFLNGLISPRLFGNVGKTIANSLNTAIYASLSFTETFDFYEFGESLAWGINDFFYNFDFIALADSLNSWVDGLEDTLAGFLKTLKWEDIINKVGDFLGTLELDTLTLLVGALALKFGKDATKGVWGTISDAIFGEGVASIIPGIGGGITAALTLTIAFDFLFASQTKPEEMDLGEYQYWRNEQINATTYVDSQSFVDTFALLKEGWNSIWGTTEGEERINATTYIDSQSFLDTCTIIKENSEKTSNHFSETWEKIKENVSKTLENIKTNISERWTYIKENTIKFLENVKTYFSEKWESIRSVLHEKLENIKSKLSEVWDNLKRHTVNFLNNIRDYFAEKWEVIRSKLSEVLENIKKKISDVWENIRSKLSGTLDGIKSKMSEVWNNIKTTVTNIVTSISNAVSEKFEAIRKAISDKLESAKSVINSFKEAISNAITKIKEFFGFSGKDFSISLPTDIFGRFADAISGAVGKLRELFGFDGKSVNVSSSINSGGSVQTYATGGFPNAGDIFIANEMGPELIGTINGRTAVGSGQEITGIREAVYDTGNAQMQLLGTAIELLRIIADKDPSVSIDGRELVNAYDARKARNGYSFT